MVPRISPDFAIDKVSSNLNSEDNQAQRTPPDSIFKMVGHSLKMLSCGKASTGLYFKGRREYASLTAGIVSLAGFIFMMVMIIIAVSDCFGKRYMESDVE